MPLQCVLHHVLESGHEKDISRKYGTKQLFIALRAYIDIAVFYLGRMLCPQKVSRKGFAQCLRTIILLWELTL